MRKTSLIFSAVAISLGLLPYAGAETTPPAPTEKTQEEGTITVLTEETFRTFIDKQDVVIVEFYSDGCSHCQKMKPIYAEVAETLKGKFPFAKISTETALQARKSSNIQLIPTFIIYKKGREFKRHQGEASANGLKSFFESAL